MSPLDKDEVQQGKSLGASFFRISKIEPGKSETVSVVDLNKNTATKYPLKGKDYCYRATLEDGRVWDVNSATLSGQLLRLGYPKDPHTFQPFGVKVSRKNSNKVGESPYEISKV